MASSSVQKRASGDKVTAGHDSQKNRQTGSYLTHGLNRERAIINKKVTERNQSLTTTRQGSGKILRQVLRSAFVLCATLFLLAMFLPTLDGPNRRLHMKEAATVSRLRNINRFQTDYAAAHPAEGFACQLPRLKSSANVQPGEYDPEGYLVSGTQYGYKYVVVNCRSDPNGVAIHYGVIAQPFESALRTFCTDESGLLRTSASPETCLSSGQVIQ